MNSALLCQHQPLALSYLLIEPHPELNFWISSLILPLFSSSPYSTHCQIHLLALLHLSFSHHHCLRPGHIQLLLDMSTNSPPSCQHCCYDHSLSKACSWLPRMFMSWILPPYLTNLHFLPSTPSHTNFLQCSNLHNAPFPGAFAYAGFSTWNSSYFLYVDFLYSTSDLNSSTSLPGTLPSPILTAPLPKLGQVHLLYSLRVPCATPLRALAQFIDITYLMFCQLCWKSTAIDWAFVLFALIWRWHESLICSNMFKRPPLAKAVCVCVWNGILPLRFQVYFGKEP